jgi:hypothetical protein
MSPAAAPPRTRTALLVLALVAALVALTAPQPAAASSGWAPAAEATIRPGVQMVTDGAQCTANFIFTQTRTDGTREVYIGYAAHCAGLGGSTSTNGCTTGSKPLGTPVQIRKVGGGTATGTLAYSAWETMPRIKETDENTCRFNDFALVRLDPADHASVNPSIPVYGGPRAINTQGVSALQKVYSYGNSGLRFGISQTSPKEGYALSTGGGGWTHTVYTATPGIPGDSGSAFLDAQGRGLGIVSTVAIAPFALSNGVSDLSRSLAYANANSPLNVTLAEGTEAFRPGLLP